MKKIIAIILTISSVLLLANCSSPTVRFDTPLYSIVRENGRCDLIPTQTLPTDKDPSDAMVRMGFDFPEFSTVDEMRRSILSGSISENQVDTIYRMSVLPDGTAPIVDLDRLYEFTAPDDLNTKDVISFEGNKYGTRFSNDDVSVYMDCYESGAYTEAFNSSLCGYLNFLSNDLITLIRQETVKERSATVYYTSTSVCKSMYICYELQHGDKHMYVQEEYVLEHDSPLSRPSSTIPEMIHLFGTDGDGYFGCAIFGPEERPSTQWLLEFGLTPIETDTDAMI